MTPHVIWGLRAIARRLGVAEEETVTGYATRARDPLRLRQWRGRYWIKTERLDAWKARQQPGNACERLVGLDRIAERMKKSITTVKSFARLAIDPLPVEGLGTPGAWVYTDAMLDWYDAQDRPVDLTARAKNVGDSAP